MTPALDVLYVEDDLASIHLLREAFDEGAVPAHVHAVQSRAEALTYLANEGVHAGAPRPDLVLLDLDLAGSSGFDVLSRLRDDGVATEPPVVVFTTSSESADVEAAYARGANAFVRKPADFQGLVAFVRGAVQFWGATAERGEAA